MSTTQTGDVLFARSLFGGFNRRDVIDYIDALQRKAADEASDDELRAQLEAVRAERDALLLETQSLRGQIAQLQARVRAEQAANAAALGERRRGESEEAFSAEAETVTANDPKELSMRDVDDLVKKYFG